MLKPDFFVIDALNIQFSIYIGRIKDDVSVTWISLTQSVINRSNLSIKRLQMFQFNSLSQVIFTTQVPVYLLHSAPRCWFTRLHLCNSHKSTSPPSLYKSTEYIFTQFYAQTSKTTNILHLDSVYEHLTQSSPKQAACLKNLVLKLWMTCLLSACLY